MLFKIILNYIVGYIKISVEGYYIERFINICRNKSILIWNLKRDRSAKIDLNIGIKDLKKVRKIIKETKCKATILNKKGLPFLFNKYRKRKIFFILLFLIMGFIIISSRFVWNIEILEENQKELPNIYEDIIDCGLSVGKLKSKVNAKEIINRTRLKRDDIAWMGIEMKGTNVIVRIVKATEKPEIIDDNDYCNIVSDKQGIITKINAQNGTIAANVGDVVDIGTPLINGWMEGKYTGIRYVHAKGEIEAKVWYTKNKTIELNTTEIQETGNIEKKYKIKLNNFVINLSKRVSKFEIYDTINENKKLKLFSNFYLPISIEKITNKEIKKIEKNYTIDEAKKIGTDELEKQLNEEIKDKEKIVNKIINTYERENEIDISVTYEVQENIGIIEKIIF